MTWIRAVLPLLLALSVAAAAADRPRAPIINLTIATFDEYIAENPCVFTIFHSPNCKACLRLEDELPELAEQVATRKLNCKLAKINMFKEALHQDRFVIHEYPTIKLFFEGLELDYLGAKEHISMTSYLTRKLNANALGLETMDEFDEIRQAEFSVVLLMAEMDPAQLRLFEIYSSDFEDIFFFQSTNPEALAKWGTPSRYNFVVFIGGTEEPKVLSSNKTIPIIQMKRFLDSIRFPMVMDLDGPGSERIFSEKKTTVFLFAMDNPHFETAFLEVAKLMQKHEFLFVKTGFDTMMGIRLAEYFGMDDDNDNSIRVLEFREARPYKYRLDRLDEKKLIDLIEDVAKGKATPYWKSEEEPPNQTNKSVWTIVGSTFDKLVINSVNPILLFVLNPECNFCKELLPKLEPLAKRLNSVPGMFVCTMNGLANEHESLDVPGFPFILLYKPDDKANPVPYHGDRDPAAIELWVREQLKPGAKPVERDSDL